MLPFIETRTGLILYFMMDFFFSINITAGKTLPILKTQNLAKKKRKEKQTNIKRKKKRGRRRRRRREKQL